MCYIPGYLSKTLIKLCYRSNVVHPRVLDKIILPVYYYCVTGRKLIYTVGMHLLGNYRGDGITSLLNIGGNYPIRMPME